MNNTGPPSTYCWAVSFMAKYCVVSGNRARGLAFELAATYPKKKTIYDA